MRSSFARLIAVAKDDYQDTQPRESRQIHIKRMITNSYVWSYRSCCGNPSLVVRQLRKKHDLLSLPSHRSNVTDVGALGMRLVRRQATSFTCYSS